MNEAPAACAHSLGETAAIKGGTTSRNGQYNFDKSFISKSKYIRQSIFLDGNYRSYK
jgi:hypothetical protein